MNLLQRCTFGILGALVAASAFHVTPALATPPRPAIARNEAFLIKVSSDVTEPHEIRLVLSQNRLQGLRHYKVVRNARTGKDEWKFYSYSLEAVRDEVVLTRAARNLPTASPPEVVTIQGSGNLRPESRYADITIKILREYEPIKASDYRLLHVSLRLDAAGWQMYLNENGSKLPFNRLHFSPLWDDGNQVGIGRIRAQQNEKVTGTFNTASLKED